jgi:hypothetical protein
MDTEPWKRVDDLLQSALQVPADRQQEFLRQACVGHTLPLQDVQSLLTAHNHNKAGTFLDHPAISSSISITGRR